MLIALIAAALTPGALIVWRLRRHGWLRAVLAGTGVTVLLAVGLLVSLIALAPLAILAAAGCALAALRAYDRGRLAVATGWMGLTAVCMWCAEWTI